MRYIVGRKRAEEALGFLAAVSDAIESTTASDAAVSRIAELTVPFLADWCAVHRPCAEGPAEPLARAVRPGIEPAKIQALERWLGPPVPGDESGAGGDPASRLDVVVALSFPVDFRGRRLGVLTLARLEREGAAPYRAAELALARELARRLGGLLEIARLDALIEKNLLR